ncbi:BMP family protein [Amycolatopsis sp. GM8]|uniref:BMP family lipoprotein n=1 Tax=Amycolatopsis sp. GM8 TaxID=2896530 RepID=UPI001EFF6C24|nr:BMP family ABC transporter substrate-binding protein [Amycolatopsis sp. GM8]
MKIKRVSLIAAAAVLALGMSACGGGTSSGTSAPNKTIANVVPGALGDQSFFDSAQSGIKALESSGYKTTTLQADTNNLAQWKANLDSVSTGQWGLVVIGSSVAVDPLTTEARKFPNQHYIFYDGEVNAPNVASITYKQNEGAYLAGVLAALATSDKTDFPLSSGSKTIGLVGAMDIPVIEDFVVGFKAGANAVDPSVKVLTSFVGSWTDSAKAYDQAKGMYGQNADVVYNVASGAGVGVLQAAKDANKYAIGVDSNQNALQPGHVLASVLKQVGQSIEQAAQANEKGTLAFGKTTEFGLANDGVGLTFDNNGKIVPDSVIAKIDDYKQQVVSGKIQVPTALG